MTNIFKEWIYIVLLLVTLQQNIIQWDYCYFIYQEIVFFGQQSVALRKKKPFVVLSQSMRCFSFHYVDPLQWTLIVIYSQKLQKYFCFQSSVGRKEYTYVSTNIDKKRVFNCLSEIVPQCLNICIEEGRSHKQQ